MGFEKRKDSKFGFYYFINFKNRAKDVSVSVNGEIWLFHLNVGRLFSVTFWEKKLDSLLLLSH